MSSPGFQTVRLGAGSHSSPAHGACVMELASMLAGERFSDHPRTVCPVIAGFLRSYNDRLPECELDQLYALAPLVLGSASTRSVRRDRAFRLLEWAGFRDPARPSGCSSGRDFAIRLVPRRLFSARPPRDQVVVAAAIAAVGLPPARRRAAVAALIRELVAMGSTSAQEPVAPTTPTAPSALALRP
jgi:hypothetical protein